ncbi:hypothetical protein B0H13DRAFT_1873311 [Mycena leptocephala]|nr:hypothetical protein B0H13DRAFT_1873311 [Mycena leptocephala]
MASMPQEVVEVVLVDFDALEDQKSLKSIALTAINFAGPAQRIIFRALALQGHEMPGWSPTFERMLKLLERSPHIAPYVKDLTITLPLRISLEQHTLLARLLPKFSNVRRFVLEGIGISWEDLQPDLRSTLSAFLLRSPLEKLHLIRINDVPLAVLTLAAQTIPVLSVRDISIEDSAEIAPEASAPCLSPGPHLTHLILSSPAGLQLNLFAELILLPSYTANLRRLAIDQNDSTTELLRAVAPTLTELSLNCTGTTTPFALPWLPHLTALALQVSPTWAALLPAWLPPTLAALLDPETVPALRTLTVRVALPTLDAYARRQDLALPGTPGTAAVLAAADAVLCGAVSRCVWELAMAGVGVEPKARAGAGQYCGTAPEGTAHCAEAVERTAHGALVFARFRAAVERNVAGLRAEGGLEILIEDPIV